MTRDERVVRGIYTLIGLILQRNFDQQLTCVGGKVKLSCTQTPVNFDHIFLINKFCRENKRSRKSLVITDLKFFKIFVLIDFNLEEEKCKFYLGLTENTFFERHKLHKTSFNNPSYSGSTSLSSFVWELKRLGISYEINFSIVKLAKSYSRESKVCDLCLTEKTEIMLADHQDHFSSLNKRSEIMAKCRHRAKHLLFKWQIFLGTLNRNHSCTK